MKQDGGEENRRQNDEKKLGGRAPHPQRKLTAGGDGVKRCVFVSNLVRGVSSLVSLCFVLLNCLSRFPFPRISQRLLGRPSERRRKAPRTNLQIPIFGFAHQH